MRYLRFQLLIATGPGDGYHALALTPRGQGRARFDLPFPPSEAAALQPALWGRHLRPPGVGPERSPAAVGEHLFATLFQGEILRLYERSLDLLDADPEAGLRLELTFEPHDPDLAAVEALPWELLRQPGTPEFLALLRRSPVTRFLAVPRPVYAAPRPRALRILAVAADPHLSGVPPLELERELANLRQAVGGAAEVVTPEAPTLAALRQALRAQECHILHFMGHGGSTAKPAEPVLFFATVDGGADPVRGPDLANKLADFPTLRLVVLNACESAKVAEAAASRAHFDAFAGVATSLVLGGLPAVVAMQLPISDAAAITFSCAFYRQLAAGDPVDAAVAEGRQAVHSANPASSEWATPVLFLRTPTGELYPEKTVWDRSAWRKRAHRLAAALLLLLLGTGALLAARRWWVERLVTQGAALFEHGQWSEARERFESARRIAPGSTEVLSNLAGTEEKLGENRSAEEHYREAARRKPDSAEPLYNLGHFLVHRQSYDEGYRILAQAVARDPERADAYAALAEAAAGLGMPGRARLLLGLALRLDPERPAFHRRLGALELGAGNPKAALPHLAEARRRYPMGDPGRVETAGLLAQVYDRLGDEPATCREITEFRRLDPQGVSPWAPGSEVIALRRGCRREP